jgi:hypothetical protein
MPNTVDVEKKLMASVRPESYWDFAGESRSIVTKK